MTMDVATVIVTWNQTPLTLTCLASLQAAGVPAATIWVVDNGSQPEASPMLKTQFPGVRVMRLDTNCGFTGGNNVGVAAALAAGAQSILLLNNDATVEPQTVSGLWTALAADPQIAAVAPKVYYHGTPRLIQSVGIAANPTNGRIRMLGSGELDRGQYDRPADREALFGCALLIRRAAWEQVGPLWEPFFAYAEEVDWCLRARASGWRLGYVPEVVVWHRASSTLGAVSPLRMYLMTRNEYYLWKRHHQRGWRGSLGLAVALARSVRILLRYLRVGQRMQARALVLGMWDCWRGRSGNARTANLRLRTTGAKS
jgi:GT2 family glycosyltransferase